MDLLDSITQSMDSTRPGCGRPLTKKPKYDEPRPGTSASSSMSQSGSFRIPKKPRTDDPSTPTSAMNSISLQESFASRAASANSVRPPSGAPGFNGSGNRGPPGMNGGDRPRGPPGYSGGDRPRGPPGYNHNQNSNGGADRSNYGAPPGGDRGLSRPGDRGSDRSGPPSYGGGNGGDRGNDRGGSGSYGGDRGAMGSSDRSSGGGGYGGNDRRGGEFGDRRGGYGGGDRGGRGGFGGDRGGHGGGDRGGRFDGSRPGGDRNDRGGYGNAEVKQEFKPFAGNTNNYGGNRSFGGGRPTGNNHLEVEMNALMISSTQLDSVKRFHVDIIKSFKGKDKDMTRGLKFDQAYIAKEMCVFGIMDVMYRTFPQLFGDNKYCHAYDGGYTLYSIGCTIDKQEDGSMCHVFSKEDVANLFPEAVTSYVGRCDSLKVSLKSTGEVYIRGPNFNTADNYREAIKFFEVVTDCYLHEGNFLNYTTKSFEKRGFNKDIGGAKLVKKGLDKNVRLIGDSVESGQLVLQASSKASAFHKNTTVLEYLAEILNCRPNDVPRYLAREKRDCEKATRELKGVFVACTHIKRSFVLRKIDFNQTAASTFFENKNNERTSIAEYYKSQYNVFLKYPECPLAIESKPGGSSYFPLELLEVMEGQRVGTAALGNNAEKVHQVARALPSEQKTNTMKQLEAAKLRHGENPYLRAFGISLDSEFIRYDAKILAPPIRIGGNNEQCVAASRSKLRKFFDAGRTNKNIVIVSCDRCMRDDDVNVFYKRFSQAASGKGMQLPPSPIVIQAYSEGDIRKLFTEWARRGDVALAIFITKDKLDPVHHSIKIMETEFAICTEHISMITVRKCMEDRGGAATVDNVLRKFNVKLGGLNEIVFPNSNMVPRGMDPKAYAEKILNSRLFIGIEMSHPAAQCLFDRQNNIELGQPTVIGMSFSLDYAARLNGFSWFQKPRCHNILKLSEKFKEALEANAQAKKRLPAEIIVYRGGGSEGEFDEIRKEVDQMRAAARCFDNGRYNPKITYVVVMAHTNNLILPANLPQRKIPAREANVPSGTLIDGGVTNPTLCEFILVPQEGNIGTSRPMRCVVLVNEAQIPKDEIYNVTYYLCYAHQASTQPTSKPNVLYAANELAKRGKNNWSELMNRNGGGSMFSGSSGVKFDIQPGEEVDAYFERKSAEVKNKLSGTYWA